MTSSSSSKKKSVSLNTLIVYHVGKKSKEELKKKDLHLYVDKETLLTAKKAKINLSQTFTKYLNIVLKEHHSNK